MSSFVCVCREEMILPEARIIFSVHDITSTNEASRYDPEIMFRSHGVFCAFAMSGRPSSSPRWHSLVSSEDSYGWKYDNLDLPLLILFNR